MELDVIRRVSVVTTETGAAAAAASLDKLASAQERVGDTAVKMGGSTEKSAPKVTSAAGAYDRLRQSIDASYRAQVQIERGQARIDNALQQGIITTEQAARSTELLRARYALNDNAVQSMGRSTGRTAAQLQNLTFQLNDIASGLASGQSPFTILAQQGGQLVQIAQMGEGGIAGTFSKIAASIAAFATPANIAVAAIAALGAGFLAYAALSRETLPSLDDALKTHTDLIARIKGAYGEASVAASAYARESRSVLTAGLQADIRALEAQLKAATGDFYNSVTYQQARTRSGMGPRVVTGEYRPFSIDIADLRSGAQDVGQFRENIAKAIASEPIGSEVRKTGEKLLTLTDPLAKIDASLGQAKGTLGAFGETATTVTAGVSTLANAMNDLAKASDALAVERAYRLATSYASGREAKDDAYRLRQDRLQQLADEAMPLPRARPNLAEFNPNAFGDEAVKSAGEQLQSLISEVTAAGMGNGPLAAYRMEQERINAAAKAGIELSPGQIAAIRETAKAYGELATFLETRKLRSNLFFDRDQAGRSPVEQQVASALRGIYGDTGYLGHMQDFEAQQIRNNAALKAMGEAARSVRDDLEQTAEKLASIGMPAGVAAGRMAGLMADQRSRAAGIYGTPQADEIRKASVAQAEYNTVADRTFAAWEEIRSTGGSAIDSLVDKISSGTASLTDLLDVARDIGKEFLKLAISNPLKNALFGENLPTLSDVSGVLGQAFGGKKNPLTDAASSLAMQTVGTMAVNAGIVNIGGFGIGGANDNLVGTAARSVGIGSDAVAGGAGNVLSFARSYRGAGVDTQLTDILKEAAARFPLKVEATSGFRAGDPRFHGQGLATDVQIYDALGKAIPNYQNGAAFRTYEQFAQVARGVQIAKYPELTDRFRWGGYFGGPKGKYGAADLMHFDLGGSKVGMGGGSWAGGLTDAQRSFFPEAESVGQSFKSLAAASDMATQSASGFGSGLNDLTNSVASAASKIGQGAGGGISLGGGINYGALGAPAAGGVYANGDAFLGGNVIPFARGDVLDRPTFFPMAKGNVGVMGEAGPEAIMPLRRLANGRLGVEAGGKGGAVGVTFIVNNNHSGARVTQEERVNASGQREIIATIDEGTASAINRRGGATARALNGMGIAPRTRKLA